MKNISLKNRLILPIALLGIVALFSNILSIINIRNVNASAATISDNHMDAQSRLAQIYQTSMTIHKMALSHIVATDYETMIVLVQQIKEEETLLDGMLEAYEFHVTPQDRASYEKLLSDYASFKHALVQLVCASAGHKPQYAYTLANGDVASWANAMEEDINVLSSSIQEQTSWARDHLSSVYVLSLVVGTAAAAAGGYTAVCAMPNLNPVPDSPEHFRAQLDIIEKNAKVRVYPYGAITRGERGEAMADLAALAPYVPGFSDDGRGVQSEDMMRAAMLLAKQLDRPIVAHCEDESLLEKGWAVHDGVYARRNGLPGNDPASEWKQVERDILSGVYQRGDSLTELRLSEQLKVSRTPVREALRRLEQDDLVALDEVLRQEQAQALREAFQVPLEPKLKMGRLTWLEDLFLPRPS